MIMDIKNKRAVTEDQKKEVINKILLIWLANPELRLSQLILNIFDDEDFFYVEDYDLVALAEEIYIKNPEGL